MAAIDFCKVGQGHIWRGQRSRDLSLRASDQTGLGEVIMPDREAPACRRGLSQREKEKDGEERSHPDPILAARSIHRRPAARCIHGEGATLERLTRLPSEGKGERPSPASRECLGSLEVTLKQHLPPDRKTGWRNTRSANIHSADRDRER